MAMQHVTSTVPRIARAPSQARRAPASLPKLVADLRDAFRSGRTQALDWRLRQLSGLERMIADHEAELLEALRADMGKPALEAHVCEIGHVRSELALMKDQLPR